MKRQAILAVVLCICGTLFAACPSADLSGDCFVNLKDFTLLAGQWLVDYDSTDLATMALEWLTEGIPAEPGVMVWISINDPGVPGYWGFNGQMSKYETTNAQYCQFLNAAIASGDITVSGSTVYGANGSNSGADFAGQVYYDLAGAGINYNGATNGGAARINYGGGSFSVDSGFENHPVTYVSWYGATAFCNYYGYRLPTEWEWQAAADYNGSYTYGCGTTINNSVANYENSAHPNGTTIVGTFGTSGYGMCDMAGNVWEWTSGLWASGYSYRVLRGGGWGDVSSYCTVSYRGGNYPYSTDFIMGFRVCR
jgi:formylglycine-generating enzyme required for sulfatase activity